MVVNQDDAQAWFDDGHVLLWGRNICKGVMVMGAEWMNML